MGNREHEAYVFFFWWSLPHSASISASTEVSILTSLVHVLHHKEAPWWREWGRVGLPCPVSHESLKTLACCVHCEVSGAWVVYSKDVR